MTYFSLFVTHNCPFLLLGLHRLDIFITFNCVWLNHRKLLRFFVLYCFKLRKSFHTVCSTFSIYLVAIQRRYVFCVSRFSDVPSYPQTNVLSSFHIHPNKRKRYWTDTIENNRKCATHKHMLLHEWIGQHTQKRSVLWFNYHKQSNSVPYHPFPCRREPSNE